MAKITACDICGTMDNVHTYNYLCDRKMETDSSTSCKYEIYDLCESCELKAYKSLLKIMKNPGEDIESRLVKIIKERIDDKPIIITSKLRKY